MVSFRKNSVLYNGIDLNITTAAHCVCDKNWNEENVISPFSRMYYIIDGKGELFYAGKKVELCPGNLYFIPLGVRFNYKCDDTLEKIFFHINLFSEERLDFFSSMKEIISVPVQEIDDLLRDFHSAGFFSEIAVKSRIYKDIFRIAEKGLKDYSAMPHSELVLKTLEYINSNLSVKLNIKVIAEALFVSQSQLTKKFNAEMKIGIGSYIDTRIIFEAEKMMAAGISIDDISEKLGFCDRFYFTRRFKEQIGMTPGEYKRQMKNQLLNTGDIL